jgi:hypothetical protein
MHTLDGNLRQLNPSMLMIADTVGSIGVAGVMGGANSEITGDTPWSCSNPPISTASPSAKRPTRSGCGPTPPDGLKKGLTS